LTPAGRARAPALMLSRQGLALASARAISSRHRPQPKNSLKHSIPPSSAPSAFAYPHAPGAPRRPPLRFAYPGGGGRPQTPSVQGIGSVLYRISHTRPYLRADLASESEWDVGGHFAGPREVTTAPHSNRGKPWQSGVSLTGGVSSTFKGTALALEGRVRVYRPLDEA
jgi:hypothetical protein